MSSINITLRGHHSARRFPERAMVHLTIESSGESEESVSNEVASTCNSLREILEILCSREEDGTPTPEAAVSSISSSHIHITSKPPNAYDPMGNVIDGPRIYDAIVTIYTILRDFSELQKFIQKLDGYHNARLNNIFWYLTDASKHEIGAEARKEAVLDAVTKANQYAQAVGFEDVTPLDIREIESEPFSPSAYPQRPTYRHSSGVSLTPQDIVLNCAVEVAFEAVCDLGGRTD